jgi:hypothetical protein
VNPASDRAILGSVKTLNDDLLTIAGVVFTTTGTNGLTTTALEVAPMPYVDPLALKETL